MNRKWVIGLISERMRLIRLEKRYSQDKMADIIGISKKTLVQIEKGRMHAGWTTVIAICALFEESEILQSVLGDAPLEVVETIAHDRIDRPKDKSMGGKVWWKEIDRRGIFLLQQNVISQHYRILDNSQARWFSSFEEEESLIRLSELANDVEPEQRSKNN